MIRLLVAPEEARAFFDQDRPLCAWPLCFTAPADWAHARLWADEDTRTALWILDHPWWGGSVQVIGGPSLLEPMFSGTRLPGRAFVRMLPATQALVMTRYRMDKIESIIRMELTPDRLVSPPEARLVESLGVDDGPTLAALYAHWPESRFRPGRLRQGYRYVGIREGDQLVAAAEQVLAAPDKSLAVIQGVLVHPDWRGRGLAKAVTAGMTERLFEAGARDVVLDVRANNLAGQTAYEHIGYRRRITLLAGPGSRR
jgi:ribosomal protein S18 acetylase RimI-like enzyme